VFSAAAVVVYRRGWRPECPFYFIFIFIFRREMCPFFYFLFGILGLGNKKGKQKIWGKKIDLYVIAVAMYFGILLLLLFRPSKGSDE
jgi:hypothetical protein